jgi:hypothetical protein
MEEIRRSNHNTIALSVEEAWRRIFNQVRHDERIVHFQHMERSVQDDWLHVLVERDFNG